MGFKGKTLSPEQRAEMSAKLKEYWTPERRAEMSVLVKKRWDSMTPEEHLAAVKKFTNPNKSEDAHKQLTEFWAGCTGEARAKKCAHLTNPEAQAKSHEAQRTPEFRARRVAWAKAAWERKTPEEKAKQMAASKAYWASKTPEERKAIGAILAERRRQNRIAKGLPPVAPRKSHAKLSPEEFQKIRLANLAKGREVKRALRAARLAREASMTKPVKPPKPPKPSKPPKPPKPPKEDRSVIARQKKGRGRPRVFASATDAAKALVAEGKSPSLFSVKLQISNVLHGRRKSAYGYRWERFVNSPEIKKEIIGLQPAFGGEGREGALAGSENAHSGSPAEVSSSS